MGLSDEQVEQEIAKLQGNLDIKLYQAYERVRNKRRKYMSQLKWMQKRGKALAGAGLTIDKLKEIDNEDIT